MTTTPATHRSFRESLAERNHQAARLCAVIAAVLMPAGTSLDLITQPAHVGRFLVYRLIGTAAALIFLAFTYANWSRRHTFLVGLGPVLACAIRVMIVGRRWLRAGRGRDAMVEHGATLAGQRHGVKEYFPMAGPAASSSAPASAGRV